MEQLRTAADIAAWRAAHPGQRVVLSGANLSEANLRRAILQGADLRGANLRGASLSEADLSEASLRWADLRGADLSEADLRRAILQGADLRGANLRWADLRGASLSKADLSEADLSEADLSEADLRGANLRGAVAVDAEGIFFLNFFDPRGYQAYAQVRQHEVWIGSGCRFFSVSAALNHWGSAYKGDRAIGQRYVAAIRALETNQDFIQWRILALQAEREGSE